MKATKKQVTQKISEPIMYDPGDRFEDPMALKEHPRNPNQHSPEQLRLYLKIIRANGFRRALTVSKRSGFVTKGNGALQAARLGMLPRVPIRLQEYPSDEAELQDMLADNELARLSHSDQSKLNAILKELSAGGIDLELAGILKTLDQIPSGIDVDPKLDQAEALRKKWRVQAGQLWRLGEHRILCGDSTKAQDVARLLQKDTPPSW